MRETARSRLSAQKRTRQTRPCAPLRDVFLDHDEVSIFFNIGKKSGWDLSRHNGQLGQDPQAGPLRFGQGLRRGQDATCQRPHDDHGGASTRQNSPPGGVGRHDEARWHLVAAQAQVRGPGRGHQARNGWGNVCGAGRDVDREVGQPEQDTVVFDGVVGGAHDPVGISATVSDEKDRQVVHADVVADLLKGTRVDKGRDAVDPRFAARVGQPGRDRHHVLLGNSGVDEALLGGVAQRLEHHEAEIAGQKDEVRVLGMGEQGLGEDGSHRRLASSTAIWYCSAVMGR